MTPTTTKLAIAIDLDQLRESIQQYVATLAPCDRLETQLRMSTFLAWLAKQRQEQVAAGNLLTFNPKEQRNGKANNEAG